MSIVPVDAGVTEQEGALAQPDAEACLGRDLARLRRLPLLGAA